VNGRPQTQVSPCGRDRLVGTYHTWRLTLKKLLIPPLIALSLAGGWFATAGASPPQGKTTICHVAGSKMVSISVSNSAMPAHMAHGDTLADEYGDCP
jgi:hypothetical protein